VRVERQLPLDIERREHEHAPGALRSELARKIERVARVPPIQQGNDDRLVPAGEAARRANASAAGAERRALEEAAKASHTSNVGRGSSAPAQNRRRAAQDLLKRA
jgi:hypothetical protein